MTTIASIAAIADTQQLLETTYRRDGTPVSTLIWPVPWGDDRLAFVSPAQAGKIKRLRNSPRITLQPGEEPGVALPGTEPVEGIAEIVEGETVDRVREQVIAKYGQEAWDVADEMGRTHWTSVYGEYTGEVAIVVRPAT